MNGGEGGAMSVDEVDDGPAVPPTNDDAPSAPNDDDAPSAPNDDDAPSAPNGDDTGGDDTAGDDTAGDIDDSPDVTPDAGSPNPPTRLEPDAGDGRSDVSVRGPSTDHDAGVSAHPDGAAVAPDADSGSPAPAESGTPSVPDAGPIPSLEPLVAPAGTWTWIPLETMRCVDGSTTGFGVNLVEGATDLALFMDGGGACVDALSCLLVTRSFGEADFSARAAELANAGTFQRTDADNPLRDMSWVYVPYCTGDVHAGNNEPTSELGLHFVGHQNMLALLERLRSAYSALDSVLVTGGSAGGFGTLFNFHDAALTFDEAEVTLIDDSGPLLGPTWMSPTFQADTFGTWEVTGSIPAECPDVGPGTIDGIYSCLADLHPTSRFGLATSTGDSTNRSFLSLGGSSVTADEYADAIDDLALRFSTLPQWALFAEDSTDHVLGLQNPLKSSVSVDGTTLADFMRGVITGEGFGDALPADP
jgi:hypothetical protein